ncbi:MAG: hypothetical protein KDK38_15350 [Leptospiraceae bacterium]|nr:hypothetical protein [Leptospiraceae bacterium]
MKNEILIQLATDQILAVHRREGLSSQDSYDVVLRQLSCMYIFLNKQNLLPDFEEFNNEICLELKLSEEKQK